MNKIKNASFDELLNVKGITQKDANEIIAFFQKIKGD